jgi:hypothetical protein
MMYRCSECGDGEHLHAIAGANVSGPLNADGEIDGYDDITEWGGVYEDSIQCTEHVDAVIEKQVDGEWRRWWCCEPCHGTGDINYRYRYSPGHYQYGYRFSRCSHGRDTSTGKAHQGWLDPAPVRSPA